jgi:hypothetical protein
MASVPPAVAPVLPAAVLERTRGSARAALDVDAVDKDVKVDALRTPRTTATPEQEKARFLIGARAHAICVRGWV